MAKKETVNQTVEKAVAAASGLWARYPNVDALVALGKLSHKLGWYTAEDDETFQLLVRFATQIETQTGKKPRFKLAKLVP